MPGHKLSKKKKQLYGAVIVVGLGFLGLEYLSGGDSGTGPAAASAAVPVSESTTEHPKINVRAQIPGVEAAAFPREFPDFLAGAGRDLFSITEVAEGVLAPHRLVKDDQANLGSGDEETPTAMDFISRHSLSAVMISGDVVIAVVDGELIEPGDKVEGCRLLRVYQRRAEFECRDGLAELVIKLGID